jgi:E3 ubiquitin-protein ligase SHPRH
MFLKIQIFIQRAQLQQHNEDDHTRYQHALETLLLAEKEANKLIEDVKTVIAEHDEKGETLKKEAAVLRELRNPEIVEESKDKGKGKAIEREASPSSDADSEDHDLPKTPAGQEHGIKRRALQQRLRECNVTLHRVKFLQGDVYHVLGGAQEDEAYAAAEEIRRSLLKCECHLITKSLRING